jgi:putative DNA primase/helicase
MTVDRKAALADRAAQVQRLHNLPAAMRVKPQWLLWKLETVEGRDGLQKVPYYVNGRKRFGKLGGEEDRKQLATFDAVCARFNAAMHFAGVGFAFLEGDGLIAVDLDHVFDESTGTMHERFESVLECCLSYTEWSPSKTGLHIILEGHTDSFKHDPVGVEVYCGDRYFTCTGDRLASAPADVMPIKAFALGYLRKLVDDSKEAAKRAKAGEAAAAPAPASSSSSSTRPSAPHNAGNDFKLVNDGALQRIDTWVPIAFPSARNNGAYWRVTSKDLGRNLQEDLQLSDKGIMDFGLEEGFSPIDIVMQWVPGMSKASDALHWLAGHLGVTLSKPPLRLVKPKAAAPAPQAPARDDERPEPPPPTENGAAESTGGQGEDESDDDAGSSRKGKKPPREIDWEKFKYLRRTFALIYGTDTVWDDENRLIMKISNMAHAHGSDIVKLWKGGAQSRRRSDEGRWTVMPQNVVFDPTETCDMETHVNLFGGFPTEPAEGDVGPILDLIKFLTSRAAEDEEECDEIKHFLLCWLAYPLQHKGAKLRTAVVMHGDEGAGKNFLTDLVVEIYGEYGATVGQDELEDKFNDWRSRKLFVVGDEVSSRAELVHNKNRLKALITSTTVQINPKNLPRREEANHINVWFNSNELQPLALDNSDRRYLVIYTPKAREREYYVALGEWKAKGGVHAFYKYLLEYDCQGFNPFSPAPVTEAKKDLIDLNRKSPERFWLEWSGGELDLPYWSCTLAQAYAAYLKYAQRTGDRYPLTRSLFTRMVLRISDTMGRPCVSKVMKIDFALKGPPDERATRMLLVTTVPEGVAQGEWATDCWKAFEPKVRSYVHGHFRGAADADGEEEPMP